MILDESESNNSTCMFALFCYFHQQHKQNCWCESQQNKIKKNQLKESKDTWNHIKYLKFHQSAEYRWIAGACATLKADRKIRTGVHSPN